MGSVHNYREEEKLATLSATSSNLVDELGEEKEESRRRCLSVAEEAKPTLPVAVAVAVMENATETRDMCRTPTAQENRIPDMLTCPPAPKKQRNIMPVVRAREFFCPPDLDAIFTLHSGPNSPFRL